jgi:RNA polymerase subunit RPABC4/transcription elongation factor Spt4
MVQYVRRVMEIAMNIGKIYLLDGKTCKQCRDLDPKIKVCPSAYPTTSQEKDMLRVVITKGLRIATSLGVIIFSC